MSFALQREHILLINKINIFSILIEKSKKIKNKIKSMNQKDHHHFKSLATWNLNTIQFKANLKNIKVWKF